MLTISHSLIIYIQRCLRSFVHYLFDDDYDVDFIHIYSMIITISYFFQYPLNMITISHYFHYLFDDDHVLDFTYYPLYGDHGLDFNHSAFDLNDTFILQSDLVVHSFYIRSYVHFILNLDHYLDYAFIFGHTFSSYLKISFG